VIVRNERLLKLYRGNGYCGFCLKWNINLEAAHILGRKIGGGSRLDLHPNIISIGGAFGCGCHLRNHRGESPTEAELFARVGERMGMDPAAIKQGLLDILALPKGSELPEWVNQ
jgi:hypothetical protein